MKQRLGDILIEANLITKKQLTTALGSQVEEGGKLGTCLIELEYVSETELVTVLSEKLKLPKITAKQLAKIDNKILNSVSKEIAQEFQIIPCRISENKLYLAMADPTDLNVIDQLAFRLGYIIKPVVVPEIRLMLALRKYYGLELSERYVELFRKLKELQTTQPVLETEELSEPIREVALGEVEVTDAWPMLGESDTVEELSDDEYTQLLGAEDLSTHGDIGLEESTENTSVSIINDTSILEDNSTTKSADLQELENFTIETTAHEEAEEPAETSAAQKVPEVAETENVVIKPIEIPVSKTLDTKLLDVELTTANYVDLTKLGKKLLDVTSDTDIATAVGKFFSLQFENAGVFSISNSEAVGVFAVAKQTEIEDFNTLQISFDEPSVLADITKTREQYCGLLKRSIDNSLITSWFELQPPTHVLVQPIFKDKKVAQILYLQDFEDKLQIAAAFLKAASRHITLAFELVELKNRLKHVFADEPEAEDIF